VAEGIVGKLVPPRLSGLHANISQTVQVVRATLKNRALFVKVALYSIAFQILVATVNACIFKAMGVPVSLAQCVIFTPMIFTVTMLPISLSGFGVRIVGIASVPGALLFSLKRAEQKLARA
jgi:uncharacterized membrane protein YbhN (UPF0104 family)